LVLFVCFLNTTFLSTCTEIIIAFNFNLKLIILNIVLSEQRETDTRNKLEESLRVCKKTMKAAVGMYNINPNVAEVICTVFVDVNRENREKTGVRGEEGGERRREERGEGREKKGEREEGREEKGERREENGERREERGERGEERGEEREERENR
jgi:hypothetical protein